MLWLVESCSPMGARASSLAQGTLLAFRHTRCTIVNVFMGWRGSLQYTKCVFNGAFMKQRGFGSWRSPWELGEIYLVWHSFFEFCAGWVPPDFAFYIRHPERIIFHTYQPWNSAEVLSLFIFLEQQKEEKMPPESWALQLRQREQRLRILLFFNRTRKNTLFVRLGIVANADLAKFLVILQMPIKSVQELAKEEGEESEAKLRGAIEISKGAIPAIAGRWRDPWRATS